MPTSEEKINGFQIELEIIAAEIKNQTLLVAAKTSQILDKMEILENLKGGLLNQILNARFEINNKLIYTNDDQRRVALNQLKASDRDFQTAQSELWTLEEQRKYHEAETEFQRKKFRVAELAMLFYANGNT